MSALQMNQRIDTRRLKKWALSSLSLGSSLRAVLIQEPDEMDFEEFLAKSSTWMKLAEIEDRLG